MYLLKKLNRLTQTTTKGLLPPFSYFVFDLESLIETVLENGKNHCFTWTKYLTQEIFGAID
jgi:hypothetical protein